MKSARYLPTEKRTAQYAHNQVLVFTFFVLAHWLSLSLDPVARDRSQIDLMDTHDANLKIRNARSVITAPARSIIAS